MNHVPRKLSSALTVLLILLPSSAALGEEPATQSARGLQTVDWVVIRLYGAVMLALGLYCARRQKSAKDYFLGGGNMHWMAVGISLFATLLSTISYLATPGEMIKNGPVVLSAAFAPPIAFLVAGFLLIPRIMRHRVTSAYELLETQLGLGPRLMAALIFVTMRLVWMGLMLNICAKAMVTMLGLRPEFQPWIVLVAGIIAVGYTTLGGLRAVVITDVVQFLLLMGGAVLTLVLITVKMGGLSWFPTQWASHWDAQPVFSFDPHVRVTVVGSIVAGALWWICTAGSDQTAIQRYMATRDVRAARRSFFVNSCADLTVMITLGLVGLALLGYYMAHPQHVVGAGGVVENADKLFPQYIANQLPVGIAGLVVVALFAAAMSSVDSGVNAVTAVVMTDFIGRFRGRPRSERHELRLAQLLTLGIGVVIVLLNTIVDKVPGNILEVTSKTVNLLVAPLFGLFFMALFVRWATSFGAIFGSIYGATAAVLVGFWDMLTGLEPLSFQWMSAVALSVNIVAGMLLSLLPTRRLTPSQIVFCSIVAIIPVVSALAAAISLRQVPPV